MCWFKIHSLISLQTDFLCSYSSSKNSTCLVWKSISNAKLFAWALPAPSPFHFYSLCTLSISIVWLSCGLHIWECRKVFGQKVLKSVVGGQHAFFSVVWRVTLPWSAARHPQLLLLFKCKQKRTKYCCKQCNRNKPVPSCFVPYLFNSHYKLSLKTFRFALFIYSKICEIY